MADELSIGRRFELQLTIEEILARHPGAAAVAVSLAHLGPVYLEPLRRAVGRDATARLLISDEMWDRVHDACYRRFGDAFVDSPTAEMVAFFVATAKGVLGA